MSLTNTALARRRGLPRRSARASTARRGRRGDPAAAAPVMPPTVGDVVEVGALLRVFDHRRRTAGQAPGVDGLSYGDFGRAEVVRVFRSLARAVLASAYAPYPYRPVPILKGDGSYRWLKLLTVIDGTLAKSLHEHMAPFWEPILSPVSHGFRPGRSTWTLLAALDAVVTLGGRAVLVNDDIRKAFDTVPITGVMDAHREHIADPALLCLVEVVLRGWDERDRTAGIAQGSAYSPTALEVYLGRADREWVREPANPPLLRYADNDVLACRDVSEGRRARARYRRLLSRHGLDLKELGDEKRHIFDLAAGETTRLLGFDLGLRDGEMGYGIGEDAWETLRTNLLAAHETANPPETARAVVLGWTGATGPAFDVRSAKELTQRVLDAASEYGFREANPETVRTKWMTSWCRWSQLRWKARDEYQTRMSQGE